MQARCLELQHLWQSAHPPLLRAQKLPQRAPCVFSLRAWVSVYGEQRFLTLRRMRIRSPGRGPSCRKSGLTTLQISPARCLVLKAHLTMHDEVAASGARAGLDRDLHARTPSSSPRSPGSFGRASAPGAQASSSPPPRPQGRTMIVPMPCGSRSQPRAPPHLRWTSRRRGAATALDALSSFRAMTHIF